MILAQPRKLELILHLLLLSFNRRAEVYEEVQKLKQLKFKGIIDHVESLVGGDAIRCASENSSSF
jgi:hypothetical protein